MQGKLLFIAGDGSPIVKKVPTLKYVMIPTYFTVSYASRSTATSASGTLNPVTCMTSTLRILHESGVNRDGIKSVKIVD